jgi:DNA primase
MDMFTFLLECAVKKYGLDLSGRTKIAAELKGFVAQVSDGVARSLYVKRIAERIGVDEQAVLDEVRKARSGEAAGRPAQASSGIRPVAEKTADHHLLEKQILAVMLRVPEIIPEVRERRLVEKFEHPAAKSLAGKIVSAPPSQRQAGKTFFASLADTEEERGLFALLFCEDEPVDLAGCRKRLAQFEESLRKRESLSLAPKIREAQEKGDEETALSLAAERQKKRREEILKRKAKSPESDY